MLLYSAGIAAVANDNLEMLFTLLTRPTSDHIGGRQRLLTGVEWDQLHEWMKSRPSHNREFFAASEWLFEECRSPLRSAR